MEKNTSKLFRQVMAMLLCLAMLAPMLPVSAWAEEIDTTVETTNPAEPEATTEETVVPEQTEPVAETEAPQETTVPETESVAVLNTSGVATTAVDDGVYTILAGTDFQVYGSASETDLNNMAADHMGAILDQVLKAHTIDAFMFGGDYNSVTPSAGYGDVQYVLNGYNRLDKLLTDKGLGNVQKIFVQGNHDHVDYTGSTLKDKLPFLNMTGGYDLGDAAKVYVLNFVDYNSGGQNPVTVSNTAGELRKWLNKQVVGEKPIFVFSHVPLHHSKRAYDKGDAQYAEKIVDVLNAAGQRGLNIIFLYGHNHSDETNNHMGGSTCYVAKGESIWVPNTAGTQLAPKEKVLNFTYMNAGFVGWFGNWSADAVLSDDLTMSVFQVHGDDVTISRYSKDGKFSLQEKAGTFYSEAESRYGYTVDSIAVPATTVTVTANSLELNVPEVVGDGDLTAGSNATVEVVGGAGQTFVWESSNPNVATVQSNGNSATIHAWSAGTAKIRVSTVNTKARAAVSGSAEFYITVQDKTVVDTGTYIYKQVISLKDGKNYVIVLSDSEQTTATGLRISKDGVTMETFTPSIAQYNSERPYLLISDPMDTNNAQNESWTFSDPDGDGYGTLQDEKGKYLTYPESLTGVESEGGVDLKLSATNTGADIQQWKYVDGTKGGAGLISKATTQDGTPIQFIYNNRDDKWSAIGSNYDTSGIFNIAYIYERTPLTYTLQISDKVGEVTVGGRETGSMIVKTWSTGKVEYIPVTVNMLSVNSSTAGTYNNVVVVYEGTHICADYTLIVGGGNEIKLDKSEYGYYYRLVNQFAERRGNEAVYLVMNRNTKGAGVMMQSYNSTGNGVISTEAIVRLDADGVPSVLSDSVTSAAQEWIYHIYKNANGQELYWGLYQINPFNDGNNVNLRTSAKSGGVVATLTGHWVEDSYMMLTPHMDKHIDAEAKDGYTTIRATVDRATAADGTGSGMYVEYREDAQKADGETNQFYAVTKDKRLEGREVYIYEKVSYTTARAAAITTTGQVAAGSSLSAKTGTAIQITYPDGQVKTVDVTVDMLYIQGKQLTKEDLTHAITISGLTLQYKGAVLTDNYTLLVRAQEGNDYPVYPDPGSVTITKEADTSKFTYDETGVARIELAVTGIPKNAPLDVLVVVDTSGSVGMYKLEDGRVRIQLIREALEELVDRLAAPHEDGSMPDVQMAITEFSDYNWFSGVSTVKGTGGPAGERYPHGDNYENVIAANEHENRLVQTWTDIQDMQNFDMEILQPNGGTNYDVALQMAYDVVAQRQADLRKTNEEREQIVIFMTDGMSYQYNYVSLEKSPDKNTTWGHWLEGTMQESDWNNLDPQVKQYFYNPDNNKHWMAEAIKGDPNTDYKVIYNKKRDAGETFDVAKHVQTRKGLGATIYTIGFGIYVEGEANLRVSNNVLEKIASSPDLFFMAQDENELRQAFEKVTHLSRNAASNAYVLDQMSEHFDLQMGAVVDSNGTVHKTPKITVAAYDLYKVSEVGTVVDGVYVTQNMVGTRKNSLPSKILEIVSFSDDGTVAYSNMIDVNGDGVCDERDNILNNGYIEAKYFTYNSNKTIVTNSLQPETFEWRIGDITEQEVILSYYVYLENSMAENGRGVPSGVYPTNNFADLFYENHLGNDCVLETVSPTLPWKAAVVNYVFYLVDEEGNVIVDDVTGETGSFVNRIPVTRPVTEELLLNEESSVLSQNIGASAVLPDGYELYDPNASYTITTHSGSNTGGSWEIGGNSGTTYVTGYGGNPSNATSYETAAGDFNNTTVWFAVKYTVKAMPDTVVIDYGIPVNINVLGNDHFPQSVAIQGIFSGKYSAVTDGVGYVAESQEDQPTVKDTANGTYGKATLNSDGTVTYALDTTNGMQMEKEEVISYVVPYTYVKMQNGVKTVEERNYYSTVTVIPATTIYYEDNFVSYSVWNTKDYSLNTEANRQWKPTATALDKTQAEDRPGEFSMPDVDANNIYGFDGAYTNMTKFSMDNSMKVTVNATRFAEAQFTFSGTGFDVVSLTSNASGTIMVDVYKAADFKNNSYNATPVVTRMVDTYYGYTRVICEILYTYTEAGWERTVVKESSESSLQEPEFLSKPKVGQTVTAYEYEWKVNEDSSSVLYQVPVMKVSGLDYGKYTAVITVAYLSAADHDKKNTPDSYSFWLDAIRIYDPANDGKNNQVIQDAYVADHEGWPEYFELRNLLISKSLLDSKEWKDTTYNGAVYIDNSNKGTRKYEVTDYRNYGPNNELYLAPGQAVAFKLDVTDKNVDKIHLAMKSVGSKTAKVIIAGSTSLSDVENMAPTNINTATDLYYDITNLKGQDVIIYNPTGNHAILSITNVKVTYKTEHTDSLEQSLFKVDKDLAEAAVSLLTLLNSSDSEDEIPETTEPVQPSEPETTEPVQPSEPETTEPVQPSEPETTEPAQPSEPETTEPVQPSEPETTEPAQPSEPEEEVDTEDLEKAIKKAKSLKKADYTTKSWNAMQAALKVAEKALADQDAAQDEIDDAADALEKAIKALTPATGKNPETGDNSPIVLVAAMGILALAGIVVLLVFKKKNRK